MKASQLIRLLEAARAQHGDLDVYVIGSPVGRLVHVEEHTHFWYTADVAPVVAFLEIR